jgi:hypothetical protein
LRRVGGTEAKKNEMKRIAPETETVISWLAHDTRSARLLDFFDQLDACI